MPATANAPRARILQLAKLVAADLRRGQMTAGLQTVGLALSDNPVAVIVVLDLLIKEVGKKRPNDALCEALLFMIGQALDETRMAVEGGSEPAKNLVKEVRQKLVTAAESGLLPPEVMMVVGQQFTAAKLDLGDELRALILALSEQAASHGPSLSPDDITTHYAAMAEAFGHDPFLIHGQLSEQLAAFPADQRSVIAGSFVASEVASMREAALGWLLDPNPSVVEQVARNLVVAAQHGGISAASAERLVMMRPWLTEAAQATLDSAVRACRQRGLQSAIKPAVQISAVIASGCDGAGAQSVFVILKRGRKLALASLLVKHGFGVRDAWVREDLSRRESDQFLAEVGRQLDTFDASPEIAQSLIAHHLATNIDRQEPPPFGLVQFLEAVSPGQVRPERMGTELLIEQLLDGVPSERQSPKAIAAALADSKLWPREYAFLQSWFEPSDTPPATARKEGTKKQREEAALRDLISPQRGRWAELLAWTAKAAQDEVEGEERIDFALVARELLGNRPLAEIPLAVWIAKNTVAASAG
ncbi:hypothetical protein FV222_03870 [Methylobacterium sp. WL103]|uniref:hypothetical protein n=1 Tax=Methylobacterium sp. WL103 TaxID=2603891 RepID=UPI0011C9B801|nr:hypothetical protein [Methylobacterium sp. WL103]TXN06948.1 hypothetical protein FV222_03870 [Methylobacterium sp. WL103]